MIGWCRNMQNNMGIAAALILALLDSFQLTMNVSNSVLAIGVRQQKALACLLIAARCTNPWRSVAPNLKNIFQILSVLYTSRDMPFQARPRQPRHPFDSGSGLFTMWSKCKAVNGSRLKDLVDTLAKPCEAPTEIWPDLSAVCSARVPLRPPTVCSNCSWAGRPRASKSLVHAPSSLWICDHSLSTSFTADWMHNLQDSDLQCVYYPPFESFRVNR